MAPDRRPPYFHFWPRDFMSDPAVQLMTMDQRGRYVWAMACSWSTDTPGLASEDDWRGWMGYSADEWPTVRQRMASAFKVRPDGQWMQKRLKDESEAAAREIARQIERGKMGAYARWVKKIDGGSNGQSISQAMPTPMLGDGQAVAVAVAVAVPEAVPEAVAEKKASGKKSPGRFAPPSIAEVTAYCAERKAAGKRPVDPETWMNYYASNGWRVSGKSPMVDWKASVRYWETNGLTRGQSAPKPSRGRQIMEYAKVVKAQELKAQEDSHE